ncbi:MAG: peptidase, partial [Nitrosopumilus sp.]
PDYLQIQVPVYASDGEKPVAKIPSWIKNNAGWWADGTIDDESFIQGIQFLIKEGIMNVPQPRQTDTSSGAPPPSWYN